VGKDVGQVVVSPFEFRFTARARAIRKGGLEVVVPDMSHMRSSCTSPK
jgi:hypothetical protein